MSMFLSCSRRKCNEVATHKCQCVTPEYIGCKRHFDKHKKRHPEVQHSSKSLTIELSEDESPILQIVQNQLNALINSHIQSEISERNKKLSYLMEEIKQLDASCQSSIDRFIETRNYLTKVLQTIKFKGILAESTDELASFMYSLKTSGNLTAEKIMQFITYFVTKDPPLVDIPTLILSELKSMRMSVDRLKSSTLNNINLTFNDCQTIYESLDTLSVDTLIEIQHLATSLSHSRSNATTLQNVPSSYLSRRSSSIKSRPSESNVLEEWKLPYCIKDTCYINSIAYSPCGNFLAVGGSNCLVKVWDMNTGKLAHSFRGHSDQVFSVSYSYDGKFIASGAGDNSIKVWSLQENSEQFHLTDVKLNITYSVSFSPVENCIASGDIEGNVRYWSLETLKPLKILKKKHTGAVYAVDISHRGDLVVSGGKDKSIRIWTISTGNLKKFQKLNDEITAVKIAPSDVLVASADLGGKVILWQINDSSKLITFDANGAVHSVCFSLDSKLVAAGGDTGNISVWSTSSGETIRVLQDHKAAVKTLILHQDYVVSGSADSTIRVRSLMPALN